MSCCLLSNLDPRTNKQLGSEESSLSELEDDGKSDGEPEEISEAVAEKEIEGDFECVEY